MKRTFFLNSIFLYALCVLIWGSTWYAVKMQMVGIAPELSVTYRFSIASLILFIFAWISRKNLRFDRANHVQFMMIGFFGYCASYVLSYKGVEHITSGLIAVFYSTIPFFNAFIARILLNKRLEGKLLIASFLGFSGVLLIFWNEFSKVGDGSIILHGLLYSLLGAASSALANVLVLRGSEHKVPVTLSNAYSFGYSALFTFIYCIFKGTYLNPVDWIMHANTSYFLSFTFLVVFGSILSFGAYYTLQYRIGATRASYMTILFPILALGYSTLLEGYEWSALAVMGLFIVLIGLSLTFYRKPKI